MIRLLLLLGPQVTVLTLTALLGLVVLAVVWTDHTPASRELASDVDASLTAAGKHCQLAEHVIGISAPKLSRALNVGEPLNLWRLAMLPDAFWLAFIQRIAARYGAVVLMPHQVDLLKGAANLGHKKMARMGIIPNHERKLA